MHLLTLQHRSLVHHWRGSFAVLLGVAVATAVLTGALLVGDSLRGSLRAAVLERLGGVACAVQSPGFFREQLAADIAATAGYPYSCAAMAPVVLMRGSVSHAVTHAAARHVQVLGVDDRFWQLDARKNQQHGEPAGHRVTLNQTLADDLGARPGDDVLVHIARPAAQSPETALGRRDDTTLTLRLTIDRVLPACGLADFALAPGQAVPRNAFIPLATLQHALAQPGRVNTLLVSAVSDSDAPLLQALCQRCATLPDLGLTLRTSEAHDYVSLESDAFLLAPPVEAAARAAAEAIGGRTAAILAYLANTIAVETRPDTIVPYSIVAAIDSSSDVLARMTLIDGAPVPALAPREILLNDWTAQQLDARPADTFRLSYYVVGPAGNLATETATFRLAGVVRLAGAADDAGFAPDYPGVTDATALADWNPPFPIDLRLIHPQDEDYWQQHRTTPKGFICLADGQRLWAHDPERFGRLTALRAYPAAAAPQYEAELRRRLDVAQLGLRVDAVRTRALAASEGATAFGGLFLGFSFFLIVAAAMLITLLYRLGVEQRAGEIGLLLATGFRARRILGLLLGEGVLVALLGTAVGLLLAGGYATLMLAGLRSWWGTTIETSFLHFHATATSYVSGYLAGLLIALTSMTWALRGVTRASPRALLAGAAFAGGAAPARTGSRAALVVAVLAVVIGIACVALSFMTSAMPPVAAFFLGGSALLVACLAGLMFWLRTEARRPLRAGGTFARLRLGVRNARRHPGRSLVTAGLVACATFVITALQAFRVDVSRDAGAGVSGTGGFTLIAESDLPLLHDLSMPAGRAALNFSDAPQQVLAGVTFIPFRLRAGDEASCLNLYQPTQPRLLGATDRMIDRGGFAFAVSQAQSPEERRNPWTLLRRPLPAGVIPAIADEASARWQMHLGLGDDLEVTDELGRVVRLHLVALLQGSILQGEVIVAESQLVRLFPTLAGYAFYLIDTPPGRETEVAQGLTRELADYGVAVTPATRRLAELFSIQNTYLAAFQTLGGLGLLLGTIGLAAVMLRNVWERRGELALLRALGFSRGALVGVVLIENMFLVGTGLLIGLACAVLVDAPHILARATPVPWASLVLLFAVVFLAGLSAGLAALLSALRAPLLPALRSE